jgi:hypothetical protein
MIHCKGMVLKSGMDVGQGRVPRVTSLGKKTEVGKHQSMDHLRICGCDGPGFCLTPAHVEHESHKRKRATHDKAKENGGFSHREFPGRTIFYSAGLPPAK